MKRFLSAAGHFLLLILAFVSFLGGKLCAIWAVVEFVLYLAKDHKFNWWSVYSIPICYAVFIIAYAVFITLDTRKDDIAWYAKKTKQNQGRTSNFQKRMDEMKSKAESKRFI